MNELTQLDEERLTFRHRKLRLMVRERYLDHVWLNYDVFKAWAMENGYPELRNLRQKDKTKPFGPKNCFMARASLNGAKGKGGRFS